MPDNLSVSITADTSKLRAELKLAQQELKNLEAAEKAAVKAGDVAEVNKTSAAYETQRRQVAALNTEYRKLTKSTTETSDSLKEFIHSGRGLGRVVGEFSNLSRGVESLTGILGVLTGGFAGGLAGVAVARAFSFLTEQINKVSEELNTLKKAAGEINLKPIQLQGAQRAVEAIGEEADVATKALQGMNAQLEELRKHPPAAGAAGTGSAFGVQVSRGGQPAPSDFSKPLQMLGIEAQVATLSQSRRPEVPLQAMKLELRALIQLAKSFDPTGLNIISKTLFSGVPSDSMLRLAPQLLRDWQTEIEKLKQSSAGATEAALKEDEELRISKNKLANAWKDTIGGIAATLGPLQIKFNDLGSTALERLPKFMKVNADALRAVMGGIATAFKGFSDPGSAIAEPFGGGLEPTRIKVEFSTLLPFFKKLTANILTTWNDLWKKLLDGAHTTLEDVQNARLPTVSRGPGRGAPTGYGPQAGGYIDASGQFVSVPGYGPGGVTQSTTPGLSDYQALPPNVVYPMMASLTKAAAQSSEDAAASSRAAAEASRTAVNAWVDSPFSGYAAGGMIRGPGTGTSDSILARLSAGEYVLNAAVVQRLGANFLDGLNGMHNPGFAGGSLPRFASGGMVTAPAGDGVTVNLHFPGGNYSLHGDKAIVAGLTREARRAGMLTGGRLVGMVA